MTILNYVTFILIVNHENNIAFNTHLDSNEGWKILKNTEIHKQKRYKLIRSNK